MDRQAGVTTFSRPKLRAKRSIAVSHHQLMVQMQVDSPNEANQRDDDDDDRDDDDDHRNHNNRTGARVDQRSRD